MDDMTPVATTDSENQTLATGQTDGSAVVTALHEPAADTPAPDPENVPIADWSAVELALPDGVADAGVLEDFGRVAVNMGLTPKQARALAHWQTEQIAQARAQLLERGSRELAQEWGGKAESNRQAVLSFISRIDRLTGGDSFSRALGESGATCYPGVVRGLLALSHVLSEDSIGTGGGAAQAGQEESAIDGLRNAFQEHRRAGR